jgi:hypothetical protein
MLCLCDRWGFVTHGCIDGYSRVVTFLQTSTTNTARSVLTLFTQACAKLGLPSRVRCDHGGENIDVAIFLSLVRGADQASVITGRSVHNQRIERLWRDVATQVTEQFYILFYQLEDDGVLNIADDVHLYALQFVFLPKINDCMNNFRHAWNSHRLRTEENKTPQQLWISGMLQNMNAGYTATAELFEHHPSLSVRVEEALSHFNVDLQPFAANSAIQPTTLNFVPDAAVVARAQAAITNLTDMQAMFTTVVDIMTNSV